MRELGQRIAIALVKAMGFKAGAARSDAENGKSALPGPMFNVLAETEADLAISITVLDDEPADEGLWRRLEMVLDGDLDPGNDVIADASDEGCLILCAMRERLDPGCDVRRRALIAELLCEGCNLFGIAEFNGPDEELLRMCRGGVVHVNIVSCT